MGGELGGRSDLDQFHVVGMGHLAVADAWGLQHARPLAQNLFTLALILENHPTARHIDHLEIQIVGVPCRLRVAPGHSTDHMGAELALGRLDDAKLAVLEERPQALALEMSRILWFVVSSRFVQARFLSTQVSWRQCRDRYQVPKVKHLSVNGYGTGANQTCLSS